MPLICSLDLFFVTSLEVTLLVPLCQHCTTHTFPPLPLTHSTLLSSFGLLTQGFRGRKTFSQSKVKSKYDQNVFFFFSLSGLWSPQTAALWMKKVSSEQVVIKLLVVDIKLANHYGMYD